MNKISATIASLAVAAASLFTSGIASASTAPGTCDFGVPSFPGFSCHDSDDISAKAGPAHTDNGPLSDNLDVDWYLSNGNKRVSVRGTLFLDAGAVGTATILVQCLDTAGTDIGHTRVAPIVSNNSFHLGLSRDASLMCTSPNLDKVRVTVTHQAFGPLVTDSAAARIGGN